MEGDEAFGGFVKLADEVYNFVVFFHVEVEVKVEVKVEVQVKIEVKVEFLLA